MLLLVLIAITVLYTVYFLYGVYREAWVMPPGPFPLPVLGNLHLLSGKPHMALLRIGRRYGPVFRLRMGCNRVVVINNCVFAKEAMLKHGADFAGRPAHFVGSLFSRDGKGIGFQTYTKAWKRQSKAIVAKIKEYVRKDQTLETMISTEVSELITRMYDAPGGVLNPSKDVTFAFGNIVSALALGQRYEDSSDSEFWALMDALTIFVEGLAATSFIDTFPFLKHLPYSIIDRVKQATSVRDGILNRKFHEHKMDFEHENVRAVSDLTDMLIEMTHNKNPEGQSVHPEGRRQAKNPEDELTEDHIIMTMNDTIMAGSETPTMNFLWIFYFLIRYPLVQRRIQEEIDDVIGTNRLPKWEDHNRCPYLEAFVTEVLRYVSVMPLGIPHKAIVDTTLGPYTIPKGTTVLMNIYAIHNDPQIWQNPGEFIPERFLDENGKFCIERTSNLVSFGLGHRSCPGETLAKMETFLFVSQIMQKFNLKTEENSVLPDTDDAIFGITLRPADFKVAVSLRDYKDA